MRTVLDRDRQDQSGRAWHPLLPTLPSEHTCCSRVRSRDSTWTARLPSKDQRSAMSPLAHPESSGDDSILDVAGLRVGHWTNRRAATGCTVVLAPPNGAVAACDIRGGAPGTRETDLMDAGRTVQRVHALLLSGGSAFGLDAAAGVMRYLEERGVGFALRNAVVPIVPGAVIADLGVGLSNVRPDSDAGYRACRAASGTRLAQGSVGAGTGATVAKIGGQAYAVKGGLGSASERLAGGMIVGALAVVNALGEIVDPVDGRLVAGRRTSAGEERSAIEFLRSRPRSEPEQRANTTLAVVATNAALSKDDAQRIAIMAHDGLARTIRPSHSPMDGDCVFALSLGPVESSTADMVSLGALTARAVERAVLRAVLRATGLAGIPSASDLDAP
jgi:L-aminopeptidase/D-esterase-like protein